MAYSSMEIPVSWLIQEVQNLSLQIKYKWRVARSVVYIEGLPRTRLYILLVNTNNSILFQVDLRQL